MTELTNGVAVPYAKNPAPALLTMPDFSVAPGGFAAGKSASDEPMRIMVIEEWGNGEVSLGILRPNMSLNANESCVGCYRPATQRHHVICRVQRYLVLKPSLYLRVVPTLLHTLDMLLGIFVGHLDIAYWI